MHHFWSAAQPRHISGQSQDLKCLYISLSFKTLGLTRKCIIVQCNMLTQGSSITTAWFCDTNLYYVGWIGYYATIIINLYIYNYDVTEEPLKKLLQKLTSIEKSRLGKRKSKYIKFPSNTLPPHSNQTTSPLKNSLSDTPQEAKINWRELLLFTLVHSNSTKHFHSLQYFYTAVTRLAVINPTFVLKIMRNNIVIASLKLSRP